MIEQLTFMEIYTLPNITSGIDEGLIDLATEVNVFIPMFLFFVFCVVFIGGTINQKRKIGSADIPMWAIISSMATLMITLPLSLTTGLIPLEVLSVVVVLTIFSGLWLFLDRNRNEV